jgi:hypothetical protein
MTAVLWALSLAKRVPRQAWAFAALVALLGSLLLWARARERHAYQQGRKDAAQGVVFDSVLLQRAAVRVAKSMAHTDTVTVQVTRTVRRLDTLVLRLPDSLRSVPEVRDVVEGVAQLSVAFDSLLTTHTAERAAWVERAKVDSAAILSLRIIATAQRDTMMTLQKRPRWRTVALGTLTGLLTGVVAGVVR